MHESLDFTIQYFLLLLQHYICWSDIPVPRISVIFSLEELREIERDCAVYEGRMERIARYSTISKEEKVNGLNRMILCLSRPYSVILFSEGNPIE